MPYLIKNARMFDVNNSLEMCSKSKKKKKKKTRNNFDKKNNPSHVLQS